MADAFSSLVRLELDFVSLGQGSKGFSLATAVLGQMKSVSQEIVEQILHRDEMQIYSRIKDSRRRYQFLMGRYVAKRNLGQNQLKFQMSDVAILRDPFGKPTIQLDGSTAGGISISHVDNLAVAMTGSAPDIGVDIEVIRKSLLLIGPTILSEGERKLMSEFSFSEDGELEGIVWSAKEAVSKYLGTGIRGALSDFAVSGCQQLGTGNFEFSFRNFPNIQVNSFTASGLVLSLATGDANLQVHSELLLSRLESLGKSFKSFRPEEIYAA